LILRAQDQIGHVGDVVSKKNKPPFPTSAISQTRNKNLGKHAHKKRQQSPTNQSSGPIGATAMSRQASCSIPASPIATSVIGKCQLANHHFPPASHVAPFDQQQPLKVSHLCVRDACRATQQAADHQLTNPKLARRQTTTDSQLTSTIQYKHHQSQDKPVALHDNATALT